MLSDAKLKERFWASVKKTPRGCWNWVGLKYRNGYGVAKGVKKHNLAHRQSLEFHGIPLIDGLVCDHICGNRGCVNPKHIRQVSQQANILSGKGVPAKNAKKVLCPKGHRLDKSHTRIINGKPYKWRSCSKCWLECQRRRRARRKLGKN